MTGAGRPLTVLYLGHTAKASGGEIALARLLGALRGAVTPVVVLGEEGPLVGRLEALGVDVRVLPLGGDTRELRKESLANPLTAVARVRDVLRYARRIAVLARELRVDLVHTNSLKAGFYGSVAARLAGVPSVWHVRDRLAPDYLPRAAVLLSRAATALLPTRVLPVSATIRSTLTALPGRRRVIAEPIPDPIDADAVPRRPRPADGPFRIAMVGRFSPWKGQVVAVRAFAAADLPPSARLVLIGAAMFGEQDYERELRAEIERLGLGERVELPGFQPDVLGSLSGFDVLVHASTLPEPFGQVVLEGMAAGVPVVATREGGPGEIVSDRVDGLLHHAGDATDLARALRELHADPELRERLVAGGLRRVRDFSPDAVAAQVLGLYDELVAGRSAADHVRTTEKTTGDVA